MLLVNESETFSVAKKISSVFSDQQKIVATPWIVFLMGDLGAGKTTFVRGLLGGFGYGGVVKSPTYTLIESYTIQEMSVLHLDLYRLNDPQELLSIGLNDYLKDPGIICIEWPEKGLGFLPPPDLQFELTPIPGVEEGRTLIFKCCSARSFIFQEVLLCLSNQ